MIFISERMMSPFSRTKLLFAVFLLVVKNTEAQRGLNASDVERGDPGPIGDPGPKGTKGVPGIPGSKGDDGEKGSPGVYGSPGLKGFPGVKGDKGEIGEKGSRGPKGILGEPGEKGPKGMKGFDGARGGGGIDGPPGRGKKGNFGDTGVKGDKGFTGLPGLQGVKGSKGERGYNGPPGNDSSEKGPKGNKGFALQGMKGKPGYSASVIVRHSQNSIVPSCASWQEKIRDGYSLHSIKVEGKIFHQELGSSGSCLEKFSTTPTIHCGKDGYCHYAMKNETSYWLATADVPATMRMPVAGRAIRPFVSRCVVCRGNVNAIAVHSQTMGIPNCPFGWNGLWTGYSFVMHRVSGVGSIQLLSSPGSCLEDFTLSPVLECHAGRGSCRISPHQHSFWLAALEESRQFALPVPVTLQTTDRLNLTISRCQVCYVDNPY